MFDKNGISGIRKLLCVFWGSGLFPMSQKPFAVDICYIIYDPPDAQSMQPLAAFFFYLTNQNIFCRND